MPHLEFRKASADESDFAWSIYKQRISSFRSDWKDETERRTFNRNWNEHDNKCIIKLDGENIGWFSCVMSDKQIIVENLHVSPGNKGIPSLVLNILVLDGRQHDQKVSLRSLKNDPAIGVFTSQGFPTETDGDHVTVDVSGTLEQWHKIWSKSMDLPWRKEEVSHAARQS